MKGLLRFDGPDSPRSRLGACLAVTLAAGAPAAFAGQLGNDPVVSAQTPAATIAAPMLAPRTASAAATRAGLETLLARYRAYDEAGGWRVVASRKTLRPGDRAAQVASVRERLAITGDVDFPALEPELYDAQLEQAVRQFQSRHGLEVDAVIGPRTRAALNVSAAARVAQIERNMERWQQLPEHLGERYVLVNIPAFELEVVEHGEVQMEMPVVVGKRSRPSPVFSDQITHLVLNPSWGVPSRIARVDILGKVKRNPSYLAAGKFRVYQGHGASARRIDPGSVNWNEVSASNFPYSFRQAPGPKNALGRVKFMFPNKYNVYLHDTSSPKLFKRQVRAFSSGCIRVSQPDELAALLLRNDPNWTADAIAGAYQKKRTRRVDLAAPVQVHLTYTTAWLDADGRAQFRPDIYKRDRLTLSRR